VTVNSRMLWQESKKVLERDGVARTEWRAPACHPERSEGSAAMGTEMLSAAKDDMGERRMTPGGRCVSPRLMSRWRKVLGQGRSEMEWHGRGKDRRGRGKDRRGRGKDRRGRGKPRPYST